MKKRKLADFLTIAGFFSFLALALVLTLIRPKGTWSYYENRGLKAWITPTVSSVLDDSYRADMERMLQEHAVGRNILLKTGTWTDLYLLHRPVVNQVVPTEDLLLHWKAYAVPNADTIRAQAEEMGRRLSDLRDVVEAEGGEFLYVAVPGQYSYFEEEHPPYLNNCAQLTELTLGAFEEALAEKDIRWLDMGEVFEELGNPRECYSPTDYHYTMAGAYETYRAILAALNENREEPLFVLGEEERVVETLPNPYLGSRGRKVFGLWDCGETTEVIYSREEIPFTRFDNGAEVAASVYALPGTGEEQIAYSIYMGGDVAETVIDTGREELPSVLIYGDSFTNPVECLMYLSCGEMRSVDLRHYREMSLADYIKLHKPDIVICIRDYEVLLGTDFNGNPFAH